MDETSWIFDGLEPRVCLEIIEELLDRLDDAQSLGHGCCYSEDLFNTPVCDDLTFYELYDDNSPIAIPFEVRIRIAIAFNRLQVWQELELLWPEEFEVSIQGGSPQLAASIAWAHAQTVRDSAKAVACISHISHRVSGCIEVTVAGKATQCWFVSSSRDAEAFFRWLIAETSSSPDEMALLSLSAFRNLEFCEGVFSGIKDMSKPYRELRGAIVTHLAALSDEGARIFSGLRDRVAQEFGVFGVDISDENGNTKSNREARRERTKVVGGQTRIFWSHTKLERDRDRIHICPEKVRGGGRLLVGIFCGHLTV